MVERPIALVGFAGSGMSLVGRSLARSLGWTLCENALPEGSTHSRRGRILTFSGEVLENEVQRSWLKSNCAVIGLTANMAASLGRITEDAAGDYGFEPDAFLARRVEMLHDRALAKQEWCHEMVDTSDGPDDAASAIMERLGLRRLSL